MIQRRFQNPDDAQQRVINTFISFWYLAGTWAVLQEGHHAQVVKIQSQVVRGTSLDVRRSNLEMHEASTEVAVTSQPRRQSGVLTIAEPVTVFHYEVLQVGDRKVMDKNESL